MVASLPHKYPDGTCQRLSKTSTSKSVVGTIRALFLLITLPDSILSRRAAVDAFQFSQLYFPSTKPLTDVQWNRRRNHAASLSMRGKVLDERDLDGRSSGADDDDESDASKNSALLRLAKLSLQDYEWRNSFIKNQEADRRVEESLARMMGDEASYVRPMDASDTTIGPLGLWEKTSFEWLKQVIEEEARRAREIVRLGGKFVRPMDAVMADNEPLGPLGLLEQRLVEFLDAIRQSERERTRANVLRPKDLEASKRGPLGEAELRASETIREILNSEKIRVQQSRLRDGIVRPIDVPGPLGEFEMAVLEIVRAEEERKLEFQANPEAILVRPKDAKLKGPLGQLEEQATEAVQRLTKEEKERLRNMQRYLEENRPMQQNQKTALGLVETVVVGVVRAPILLFQIVARVRDLLSSEALDVEDSEILRREKELSAAKRKDLE
jgi:hypothetical protein